MFTASASAFENLSICSRGVPRLAVAPKLITDQVNWGKSEALCNPLGADFNLTCVCANVAAQQPGPGKRLPAGGADTRQGV